MNLILMIGITISVVLVMLGGTLFLLHYGYEDVSLEFIHVMNRGTSFSNIIASAWSFSPLGIIESGLLTMIATQVIRVAMLAFFYCRIRDYWFVAMSLFILVVMILGWG